MYEFRGFNVPVDLLNKTGGGVETFEAISNAHISILKEIIKLKSSLNILEIGCGIGRDAMPLTQILDRSSSYFGIDIIADSIQWCKENISSKFPNFSFVHFDVKDQLHNPSGSKETTDFIIPCADESIDCIILWSVFTHMKESDIVHYLKEFHRVLRVSGKVFATMFVVNQEIISTAQASNRTIFNLRFEHLFADGCFINDINYPMGAVAYTIPKIREMVDSSMLKFNYPIMFGSWSGLFPPSVFDAGQDAIVLKK